MMQTDVTGKDCAAGATTTVYNGRARFKGIWYSSSGASTIAVKDGTTTLFTFTVAGQGMAEERGKESDWWLKCQGTRLRQKARHEFETSPAGRRLPQGLFLCEDGRHEEEVNQRKNGKRSRLTHQ